MVQAVLQLPDGKGKWISKGPQLFIVPIRDAVTHYPLPGVTVGDIGPKSYRGFGLMDNGYLHLDSIRIPLDYMLQRFAKLSPSGEYTPGKHSKLSYGSMVALRALIPADTGRQLARAVTIAVRYCVTRRQFSDGSDQERRVIEYASTKYRLYPLVARAYAYILAGRRFSDFYKRMLQDLTTSGDVTLLPEVHALSTALKAQSTWQCIAGLEEARKTMGGHGYSHMSGVGSIFASLTPAQTFEGDNYVISQQIARALLKVLQLLKANPDALLPESFAYLKQVTSAGNGGEVDWNNRSHQLTLLHRRAAHILNTLAATLSDKPWSEHTWTCSRLAAAHADIFVVASLPEELPLSNLHALTTLLAALPELVEAGMVSNPAALRKAHEAAMDGISVGDAVRFTDAFDFDDWELPGVVGGKEGGVYANMLETAVKYDVSRGETGEELRQLAMNIVGHSKKALPKL
jgi:acyl-CoA oxidase